MEDFTIQDDLQVDNNYKEPQIGPTPPKPGTYELKVEKWQYRRDKQGNMVLHNDKSGNPKYPVVSLTTVSITQPTENARKVVVFQDVRTAPFERDGKLASGAADLLRAIDAELVASNTGDVLNELGKRLNGSHSFRARIDVEGYDGAFVESEFARLGGKDNLDKAAVNAVYNSAKIRGGSKVLQSNIKNGKPNLPFFRWVGPSGNVIECKPVITQFIPSNNDSVQLGVDKAFQQ